MDLIVGMHRSGSSLLARILCRAGANFGNPAKFYPGDQWNPEGYFEQMEVLRLNRKLLHGLWGRATFFLLPSRKTMLRRGRRNAPALREAIQEFEPCVVKDPRFNFTGPVWEEHGARFRKMIVCLRDPLESAMSLKKRNRLPIPLGLSMWRDHYERLLENYGDRELWVVDHSRLVSVRTSIQEARGVIRYLNLPFRDGVDDIWVHESIRYRKDDSRPKDVIAYPERIETILAYFSGLSERQSVTV